MVFRPNGGANIRNDLGSEYHVPVDVIGAKDKRKDALNAVQRIVDYVQANPMADECVGYIQNMGAIPRRCSRRRANSLPTPVRLHRRVICNSTARLDRPVSRRSTDSLPRTSSVKPTVRLLPMAKDRATC
jgi:hypothetical protein